MRSQTRHVDMPGWMHAVFFAGTLLSAGLLAPLWVRTARQYRREHTVTVHERGPGRRYIVVNGERFYTDG